MYFCVRHPSHAQCFAGRSAGCSIAEAAKATDLLDLALQALRAAKGLLEGMDGGLREYCFKLSMQ